jgi:hypothetical protein
MKSKIVLSLVFSLMIAKTYLCGVYYDCGCPIQTVDSKRPSFIVLKPDYLLDRAIHRVLPVPPKGYEKLNGKVIICVIVGSDGSVKYSSPLSGPHQLQSSAQAAAMQWKFRPLLLNGEAIWFKSKIVFSF